MVTRFVRMTQCAYAVVVLAIVTPMIGATSCADVWGFDPLSLAPDGGSDASTAPGSDGAVDCGPDAASCSSDSGFADSSPDSNAGGGGVTCESANGTCRCSVNPPSNGLPCSPASLGVAPSSVVCCADPSYPQNGSCMCQWIGCTTSNGVCLCGPGNGAPGGSCPPSSWTCCLQTGAPECLCAAASCQTGFTPFGNACAISDIKCPGAQREVASCN